MRALDTKDNYAIEKGVIVELLERSSRALSVYEIRSQYKRNLPDYLISRILRTLSIEGSVSYRKGKWSFVASKSSSNKSSA